MTEYLLTISLKKITYARSLVDSIYTGVGNYLGYQVLFIHYFVDFFACDFKSYFNIEVSHIRLRKEHS